jgi:hypothetical protein
MILTHHWDIPALDTARSVPYLNNQEKDVILELNMARSDPELYADLYVRPQVASFEGDYKNQTDSSKPIATATWRAWLKSIASISRARPLTPRPGLCTAATDFLKQFDPSKPVMVNCQGWRDRRQKYGTQAGAGGESYVETASTPRDCVIRLLVRGGGLSRDFRYVGVARGEKDVYAVEYAQDWTDKSDTQPPPQPASARKSAPVRSLILSSDSTPTVETHSRAKRDSRASPTSSPKPDSRRETDAPAKPAWAPRHDLRPTLDPTPRQDSMPNQNSPLKPAHAPRAPSTPKPPDSTPRRRRAGKSSSSSGSSSPLSSKQDSTSADI